MCFDPATRRPGSGPAEWASLSFAAGLAVAEGLETLVDGAVRLKWPNDVLIDGRKAAGLLIECAGDTAVIGIGVNVAAAPDADDLLDAARAPTAVAAHVKPTIRRVTADMALDAIDARICDWIARWAEGGAAALRGPWLERAIGVGEPAVARLPDREIHGVFQDLDESGALLLRTDAGIVPVHAGDVFPTGDPPEAGGGPAAPRASG